MSVFAGTFSQGYLRAVSTGLLMVVVLVAGCQSPEEPLSDGIPVQSEETQISPARPDLIADDEVEQALIGVWMGQATMDEEALVTKLESLQPEQQLPVKELALDFLTTVMAIDLRADGFVEKEIELTLADGEPLRDGGPGQWRMVQRDRNRVLVEMTLRLADGSMAKDQQWFEVNSDGNTLTVPISLGDDLDGCNPQIVLYRQMLPGANLARQNDEAMSR